MYGNQYADLPEKRKESPFLPAMKPSNFTVSEYARNQPGHCFMPGSEERMRNKLDTNLVDAGAYRPRNLPDGFELPKPGEPKKYLPNPMDYTVPPGTKFDCRGMPVLRSAAEVAFRDRLRGFTDVPSDGSPPTFFGGDATAVPSPMSLTPDYDRPHAIRRAPLAMLEHPCVPLEHKPQTVVYTTAIDEDPTKHGKRYWAKQQLKKMVGKSSKPSKYGPTNPPANLADHICPTNSPYCHIVEGSEVYWTPEARREFEMRTGRTVLDIPSALRRSRARTHDLIVDAKDKGRKAKYAVTKRWWSTVGTVRRSMQKKKIKAKQQYKETPPKVLIQRLPVGIRVGAKAWKTEWKNGAKEREYLSHARTAKHLLRRLRFLESPARFAWEVFRERMMRPKIQKHGDNKFTRCNQKMPKKWRRRGRKATMERLWLD